jgi:hypothetical protein
MKIKITESQYNKIKLIKESEDQLAKFRQFCTSKSVELDNIYSKITFESVGEILAMNMDIKNINRTVSKIEDIVYKAEKQLLSLYDNGALQGEEDMDMILGDIADIVNDKARSLTLILDKLEALQDYQEEYNLTSQFSNVKPMDI